MALREKNLHGTVTLYRTKGPKTFADGEYFAPQFDFERQGDHFVYFVREKHGYWSDTEKRVVHVIETLSPDEGYTSYEEGLARYEQQLLTRIKDGFVHAYSLDPCKLSGDYIVYEFLGDITE